MVKLTKSTVVVLLSSALSGCWGGDDFKDLRGFMAEVDARPAPPIEPAP